MARLTDDELDEIATRLFTTGRLAQLFTTMPEGEREVVATHLARFMYDKQSGLRRPENTYTPRFLIGGEDVNLDSAGAGLGHAGPTLPRIINFESGFTGDLETGDAQQLNIRGGGGGLMCFHYMVASCWADEITAGRGTQGQLVTLFNGCDVRLYSTFATALVHAAAQTDFANVIIGTCPGDYVEELAWPTNGGALKAIEILGLGPKSSSNGLAGCVRIGGTTAGNEGIEITTNPCDMILTNLIIRGHTDSIQMTTGTGGQCRWQDVRFEKRVEMDAFLNVIAERCDFAGGVYAVGANFDDGSHRFFNCIGTLIDFSLAAHVDVMDLIGCSFASVAMNSVNDLAIIGGKYSGTNNVIRVTCSGLNSSRIIIETQFTGSPVSGGEIIDIVASAGSNPARMIRISSSFHKDTGAVSSSTCFVRLTGISSDKVFNGLVSINAFGEGSVTPGGDTIEANGGYSVIGDYVENFVFGPNSPATTWKANITNGANNEFYPPSASVTAPPSSGSTSTAWPQMNIATDLTIASGVITITQDHHRVDTEAAAATDFLDTINGFTANKFLVLHTVDPTRDTIITADGNIFPLNLVPIRLRANNYALLWYDSALAKWQIIAQATPRVMTDTTEVTVLEAFDDRFEITVNTALISTISEDLWEVSIPISGFLAQPQDTYTIVSDKVTTTTPVAKVDTEAAAATDDLDSIEVSPFAFPQDGQLQIIRAADDTHTVVIKHNNAGGTTGHKFFTNTGFDIALSNITQLAAFIYDGTLDSGNGGWQELFNTVTRTTSVAAIIIGSGASTAINKAVVGPMLQGGRITAVKVKHSGSAVAIGATAWIGDIHKILAANVNTDGLGITLYTTQANRPTITSGNRFQASTIPDVTTFAVGDYFAFFTDQSGTSAANIAITLEVIYE